MDILGKLNVVIHDDLSKLKKQIKALEWQIEQDTNDKDKSIHQEALNNLKDKLKEKGLDHVK